MRHSCGIGSYNMLVFTDEHRSIYWHLYRKFVIRYEISGNYCCRSTAGSTSRKTFVFLVLTYKKKLLSIMVKVRSSFKCKLNKIVTNKVRSN